MTSRPTRRQVLAGGGAILLSFTLPLVVRRSASAQPGVSDGLASYLRLDSHGRVTALTGKVEIGQGIGTALSQIVAEELDLPLSQIDLVTADTARTVNDGYTAGSMSIESSGAALRRAAAELKQVLLEIAAQELDSDVSSLVIEAGSPGSPHIRSTTSGRSVALGELASRNPMARRANGDFSVEAPGRYAIVGESSPRIDLPAKVFGQPAYVHDLRLDGMLHARIVRPPRYGARLESFEPDPVRSMAGVVRVHRDGSFLATVAEREEQAIAAADRARELAEWSQGASPQFDRTTPILGWLRGFDAKSAVIHSQPAAASSASNTAAERRELTAIYEKPFLAHGSIGPSCALALQEENLLTIWSHTQGPFPLRSAIATVLVVPEQAIRVVHMQGSGCYGHNGADDVALDAALLARALPGRPIRVQWSRHDEHCWEPFGSAMAIELRAALDQEGRVVEWQHQLWSHPHSTRPGRRPTLLAARHLEAPVPEPKPFNIPLPSGGGARNAVPLYDFPGQTVRENFIAAMPIRVSALRSLGAFANVFAIESFVDELAESAGVDPIEFRLRHLKDARARAVLERLAELAAMDSELEGSDVGTDLGSGLAHGIGYAFAQYKNRSAYCAVAVHAMVERSTGRVSIPSAVAVADAGLIINPDGAKSQIEGGIAQAASWTLHEQVTTDPGGVTSRDWNSYPVLRFSEAPRTRVELIERRSERSLGLGEASQGPTGAAICNAVCKAAGVRLRALPLTPDRVAAALRSGRDEF